MTRLTQQRATDLLRHLAPMALVALALVPSAPASAQSPAAKGKFPLVVWCSFADTERYYYLSTIKPDGRAVYLSPDHFAATITVTGTATKIGAKGNGTCADKTIEELQQSGQAFSPGSDVSQ